mmetsp:Transcript_15305/g.26509  ORF Transcript_15305/g.26509 Transcript_15305/m.26509 type:complete len:180 (-) Transcript_15305:461-1000(-)
MGLTKQEAIDAVKASTTDDMSKGKLLGYISLVSEDYLSTHTSVIYPRASANLVAAYLGEMQQYSQGQGRVAQELKTLREENTRLRQATNLRLQSGAPAETSLAASAEALITTMSLGDAIAATDGAATGAGVGAGATAAAATFLVAARVVFRVIMGWRSSRKSRTRPVVRAEAADRSRAA